MKLWKVTITVLEYARCTGPSLLLLALSQDGSLDRLLRSDLFWHSNQTAPLFTLSSSSASMREFCSSDLVLLALSFINSKDEKEENLESIDC